MSDASTHLSLPYLAAGQAQKHVTVNEAFRKLDAVVQLSVVSATTTAQPGSPTDGAVYIIPSGKTGAAWSAFANWSLGYYRDGAWEQITPREGWIAYVKDTDQLQVYTDSAWSVSVLRTALGLGTAATQNTGASGAAVPLLNAVNTWSADQGFSRIGVGVAPLGTYPLAAGRSDTLWECAHLSQSNASPQGCLFRFANISAHMDIGLYFDGSPIVRMNGVEQTIWKTTGFMPFTDNTHTLGASGQRWSTVYAATGTINTSDAREKTALSPLPAGVKRAMRRILAEVGAFQWLASVTAKGADAARQHVGVTAQAVAAAFRAEGEDPERWGLFCADPVWESVETAPRDGDAANIPPGSRHQHQRLRLDANGEPVLTLGVRPDQLFWLALAVLAAD